MKSAPKTCQLLFVMICITATTQALGQAPLLKKTSTVTDVKLVANGRLIGLVVGDRGNACAGETVQIWQRNTLVAWAQTDGQGRYQIDGLRNGVHVVKTKTGQQVCRFWHKDSAPPSAKRGLVSTVKFELVRGQSGCGECSGCGKSCGSCTDKGCLLGGISGGALVGIGVFAATTAVTLATTVGRDDDAALLPPASP